MILLPLRKQIYTEGGYMLDSLLIQIGCILGALFGMMLTFYLALCFIQWISDVIDEQRWKWWV